MFCGQAIRRLVKVCCLDAYCETGCFPQTGGKQRAHEAIGTIRFTSSSEITNPDNVLFQATRVPVYSGMTLLSEKLVKPSTLYFTNLEVYRLKICFSEEIAKYHEHWFSRKSIASFSRRHARVATPPAVRQFGATTVIDSQ